MMASLRSSGQRPPSADDQRLEAGACFARVLRVLAEIRIGISELSSGLCAAQIVRCWTWTLSARRLTLGPHMGQLPEPVV